MAGPLETTAGRARAAGANRVWRTRVRAGQPINRTRIAGVLHSAVMQTIRGKTGPAPDLLAPYTLVHTGEKHGYVLTAESEAVAAALLEGAYREDAATRGRGNVGRFALADGEGVIRCYRRGGLMALLSGDRYLRNRMQREFALTARLFQAGLPVPQPLGVVWERRGFFYRGAIATRAISGVTLLDYLRGQQVEASVLGRVGQCIRTLHDAGVWHADLQAKNILVDAGGIWILDLDNARYGCVPGRIGRARNLLRLRRSLEKHGQTLDNFPTILEGYGKLGLPVWLSALYRIRGMVSGVLTK